MTLFGTADVDCLRREGDGDEVGCRSRGDSDLEASERAARSEPSEGDMLPWPVGRFSMPPPGWKGSVTARGRDLGRPLSGGVNESWSICRPAAVGSEPPGAKSMLIAGGAICDISEPVGFWREGNASLVGMPAYPAPYAVGGARPKPAWFMSGTCWGLIRGLTPGLAEGLR